MLRVAPLPISTALRLIGLARSASLTYSSRLEGGGRCLVRAAGVKDAFEVDLACWLIYDEVAGAVTLERDAEPDEAAVIGRPSEDRATNTAGGSGSAATARSYGGQRLNDRGEPTMPSFVSKATR